MRVFPLLNLLEASIYAPAVDKDRVVVKWRTHGRRNVPLSVTTGQTARQTSGAPTPGFYWRKLCCSSDGHLASLFRTPKVAPRQQTRWWGGGRRGKVGGRHERRHLRCGPYGPGTRTKAPLRVRTAPPRKRWRGSRRWANNRWSELSQYGIHGPRAVDCRGGGATKRSCQPRD